MNYRMPAEPEFLIVGSFERIPIGYKGRGMNANHGNFLPDQPYVIMREATEKEWRAQHTDPKDYTSAKYFYAISTD